MATPAQLAARKIKAPKSRTGRSTTPTLGSSTFGAQQSQPSFSFGAQNATQSFPPPAQQQSFNFSVPNTSSSFTFGQQNHDQQQASNPFASNGAIGTPGNSMSQPLPSSQPAANGLFGGFGNVSQPQSQSSPAASTNGFNFGQSSGTSFGANNAFGQQKPQEEQKPLFSFGSQPSQPQTNGFSPTFGQGSSAFTPATSALSSSTSFGNVPSTSPAPAPTFKFGNTSVVENKSATPEPVESTTPKAKPAFGFGQSTSFSQSTTEAVPASAPAKPTFSFGQPSASAAELQPATTPSKPLFGSLATAPNPTEPATAPAKSLFNFGQPFTSISNPFDSPSKPTQSAESSAPLFSRASPVAEPPQVSGSDSNSREASGEPEKPSNPFSGLFGTKPSAQVSAPAVGFQFKNDTAQTLSPAKAPVVSDKPSLFSFAPAASATTKSSSTPAAASPSNLFNLNKPTPSAEPESAAETGQTSTSVFSRTMEMNANAGSTPFKAFGQTSVEDAGPAKKKLFQSPTAAESMSQSASGQSGKISGPVEPVQPKFTQPQKPQPAKDSITRAVSTEGPPQIPRYLSGDKYKSYDENWRLKALNRRFKNAVAQANPDTQDFLSLLQNYLDHRESIGDGLSRWMRVKTAGSKRKADDVDDLRHEADQSKKSKSSTTSITAAASKPKITGSSLFGSVPSPKPATNVSPSKGADSNTSSTFKSLIPGATTSSAQQTAAPLFSFTPTPAKSTTPPTSPPKVAAAQPPKFQPPKFGSDKVDFAGAFAKNAASSAEKAEREAKAKRKAEDFDSDEDDEQAWEKKYEEEQKQKKAKLGGVAKTGFMPAFIPSADSSRSNSPFSFAAPVAAASVPRLGSAQPLSDSEKAVISIESDGEGRTGSTSGESNHAGNESGNSGDDEDEDEEDVAAEQPAQEPEEEGEQIPDLPVGESLFSRISKPQSSAAQADEPIFGSAAKPYYKPAIMFDGIGKQSPEQPTFSPFTPKGDFKPASQFNFTSAGPSGPTFGSSLKEGPIPGEGLFGSRPSTPQPGQAKETSSVFGSAQKPSTPGNNTWTKGSPIKFSDSTDTGAPVIEVSAATPPSNNQSAKTSLGNGFFGAASSSGGSVGFSFGTASAHPAPGYLAAASHLGSGPTSGLSSRGSSPGLLSEAESVNTDASTAQDEEHSNQPQISLMGASAGEENEEVLFEAKAQLSRNYRKVDLPENTKLIEGWNKVGTGFTKLLKHKETGKCRLLFRAEPNANILLNTRLVKGGAYQSVAVGKNGALTFPVAVEGGMQTWMVRVKTKDQTDILASKIEENKAN